MNSTRASEAAHYTFATPHAGEEPPSSIFHFVITVPGHQVAMVNNVLLTFLKLSFHFTSAVLLFWRTNEAKDDRPTPADVEEGTHLDSIDRTIRSQPSQPSALHPICEKAFATE